uniref:Zinc finger transcription factor YY1-like isoform X1 n=1 Tax=Tanacetum cinerariifolium TaxID=118510 RepID=A0A699JAA1_TANCI|nr:zinc finger transcription factor YY1-like isoform X1 [Tanacetum cinerariifolium]
MAERPLKYVHVPPVEKPPPKLAKPTTTYASPSSNRPYACPYNGCGKAYIHEYKLNLHLKREHPGHFPEENPQNVHQSEMDAGSDHDGYIVNRGNSKSQKQFQPKPNVQLPPSKVMQHNKAHMAGAKKQTWPVVHNVYDDEDSEETEEDRDEGHFPEENPQNVLQNEMDAGSDHDGYIVNQGNSKSQKQFRAKPNVQLPPSKVMQHNKAHMAGAKKQTWPVVNNVYDDEDSEETEEDRDEDEGRWGYDDNHNHEDDDEETDYEN